MRNLVCHFLTGRMLVSALASVVEANRGATTTRWRANGVRFTHTSHGRAGWERHSRLRPHVTKISGKLWGSKIEGLTVKHANDVVSSSMTVTSPTGQIRRIETVTERSPKGERSHTSITMQPGGVVRTNRTWVMKNTEVTQTSDYKIVGEGGLRANKPFRAERRATKRR